MNTDPVMISDQTIIKRKCSIPEPVGSGCAYRLNYIWPEVRRGLTKEPRVSAVFWYCFSCRSGECRDPDRISPGRLELFVIPSLPRNLDGRTNNEESSISPFLLEIPCVQVEYFSHDGADEECRDGGSEHERHGLPELVPEFPVEDDGAVKGESCDQ